jgi:accessory gene regulator protein AgrB
MDWLIGKIQHRLYSSYGKDMGYKIIEYVYAVLSMIIIGTIMWFTNNFIFFVINMIVINLIRAFSSGYHADNLNKCLCLSVLLLFMFGYILKSSLNYTWLVFIISLFCCRDIISKSPVNETDFTDNKTVGWHKQKLTYLMFWLLVSVIILLRIEWILGANSILLSIVMVDVLLFKNNFKTEGDILKDNE